MTKGQLYDLVRGLASEAGLSLVGMSESMVGHHFELVLTDDPAPEPMRRRHGFALNNGELTTHTPLDDYLRTRLNEVASKLKPSDALASVALSTDPPAADVTT
jgi:hypothetical protein